MTEQQEAPDTVGAVRGPENQLGGGFRAMLQRTPEQWLQYAHDHIREILADAIKWQQHVREEWEEEQWMSDDPVGWYVDTFYEARVEARKLLPAIAAMRSAMAVRNARASFRPIHQLKATPGWDRIAIPGKPGEYLTYKEAA
jgi:hypothetical protein